MSMSWKKPTEFYIQCEQCLANDGLWDGKNNAEDIKVRITGPQLVEIKCSCGAMIVLVDGDLI